MVQRTFHGNGEKRRSEKSSRNPSAVRKIPEICSVKRPRKSQISYSLLNGATATGITLQCQRKAQNVSTPECQKIADAAVKNGSCANEAVQFPKECRWDHDISSKIYNGLKLKMPRSFAALCECYHGKRENRAIYELFSTQCIENYLVCHLLIGWMTNKQDYPKQLSTSTARFFPHLWNHKSEIFQVFRRLKTLHVTPWWNRALQPRKHWARSSSSPKIPSLHLMAIANESPADNSVWNDPGPTWDQSWIWPHF